MLSYSLCMDCGELSFSDLVFIGDVVDVYSDGCINGGHDVPTGVRECVLMENLFRRSMS